jgi:hypothetical protein
MEWIVTYSELLRRGLPLVAALLALHCSAGPLAPPLPPSEVPTGLWRLPDQVLGTQSLYRLSLTGGGKAADLRLTVYQQDRQRYRLVASDSTGRAFWRLDSGRDVSILQDHRRQAYCRVRPDSRGRWPKRIRVLAAGLPRLLAGRVPVTPRSVRVGRDGGLLLTDSQTGRWKVEVSGDKVASWELRRRGGLLMRWGRRPTGGELEIANRGKIEWSLIVREALRGELGPPGPPDGYLHTRCDAKTISELWQDQSAPGGAGTAR